MSNAQSVLEALVAMSRELGRPERDLVILGEGNTSALCDEAGDGAGTFWVKGSGTQLSSIDSSGFVQVRLAPVCALAEQGEQTFVSIRHEHVDGDLDALKDRWSEALTRLDAAAEG